MNQRPLIHVLILALAIVLAGAAIGSGVQRFRLADRSVTVKGVAERPVKADIALWPMRIVASGMELGPTQDKIATDQRAVRRFFAARRSGARVGPLRRASQGLFEILPRDRAPGIPEGSQLEKVLRVVTTLEYVLQ